MSTGHLTQSRRRRSGQPDAPVAIELDLCRSALSAVTEEIVEGGMRAVTAEMHRIGLRHNADDNGVRQALREIVADNLCDMLAERIKEIDDTPNPRVRARLMIHRETLIELLSEYRQ